MQSAEQPLISVIIPAHNAARSLARAVASVRASGYPALEVVVCDDGSQDDTAAVASRAAARCVRQNNAGPAAARNTAIRHARGEIFAFLDADDVWPTRSLSRELSLLQQGNDLVWGLTQLLRCHDGQEISFGAPWRPPLFGSVVMTRPAFERVGPLCESLREGEDVEWFVRARDRRLRVALLDEVTLHYRSHDDNQRKPHDGTLHRGLMSGIRAALLRRKSEAETNRSVPT